MSSRFIYSLITFITFFIYSGRRRTCADEAVQRRCRAAALRDGKSDAVRIRSGQAAVMAAMAAGRCTGRRQNHPNISAEPAERHAGESKTAASIFETPLPLRVSPWLAPMTAANRTGYSRSARKVWLATHQATMIDSNASVPGAGAGIARRSFAQRRASVACHRYEACGCSRASPAPTLLAASIAQGARDCQEPSRW